LAQLLFIFGLTGACLIVTIGFDLNFARDISIISNNNIDLQDTRLNPYVRKDAALQDQFNSTPEASTLPNTSIYDGKALFLEENQAVTLCDDTIVLSAQSSVSNYGHYSLLIASTIVFTKVRALCQMANDTKQT